MAFDRTRADAEIVRNRLVRQALRQSVHHVAFSPRKRLQANFSVPLAVFGSLLPRKAREPLIERCEESLFFEWLLNEIDGAGLHRLNGKCHVAVARHDDHWQTDALVLQCPLDLETVHPRHANVEEDAALVETGALLEQLDTGFISLDAVTRRLQHETD